MLWKVKANKIAEKKINQDFYKWNKNVLLCNNV